MFSPREIVTLVVSFLTDALIAGGGVLTGAMAGAQSTAMPSGATWLLAGVTALVTAARGLQKNLSDPVVSVPPAAITGGA